jgi:hypothetical protein
MDNNTSLSEGQIPTGSLFSEPARTIAVNHRPLGFTAAMSRLCPQPHLE